MIKVKLFLVCGRQSTVGLAKYTPPKFSLINHLGQRFFGAYLVLIIFQYNTLFVVFVGLSEWDEDDIIAQVIAQSQQEYLDNLKKNAQGTREPNPGCSKDS